MDLEPETFWKIISKVLTLQFKFLPWDIIDLQPESKWQYVLQKCSLWPQFGCWKTPETNEMRAPILII